MSLDIRNLSHVEQDVGQHIKSTKKRFIWEFLLDGKTHKVELYDSKLSGKKKIVKDGHVWKETAEDIAFSKSFEIGKHACTLIQHGEKYELRIDNQSFNHLMDLEKNKVFFTSNVNPTSNTFTSSNINMNSNKIGFGVGNVSKPDVSRASCGLFNFAIKPVVAQENRRFSELKPIHGFGNVNSNQQVKPSNGGNLLDFTIESTTNTNSSNQTNNQQVVPNQSKMNSLNILETIDFSGNNLVGNNSSNSNQVSSMDNYQYLNISSDTRNDFNIPTINNQVQFGNNLKYFIN